MVVSWRGREIGEEVGGYEVLFSPQTEKLTPIVEAGFGVIDVIAHRSLGANTTAIS